MAPWTSRAPCVSSMLVVTMFSVYWQAVYWRPAIVRRRVNVISPVWASSTTSLGLASPNSSVWASSTTSLGHASLNSSVWASSTTSLGLAPRVPLGVKLLPPNSSVWASSTNFLGLAPRVPLEQIGVHAKKCSNGLLCNANKKRGFGILMFAYAVDKQSQSSFLQQAEHAANSWRLVDPSLQICLVCNEANLTLQKDLFDSVVLVRRDLLFHGLTTRPDGLSRQWMTRLYYMAATPFEITLALDASHIPCGEISSLAPYFASESFDIAVASSSHSDSENNPLQPHNWAILYKMSNLTQLLFKEWLVRQLQAGVAADDQSTLRSSYLTLRSQGLRVKKLDNAFAAAFLSVDKSTGFFPRQTRLLQHPMKIIHSFHSKHSEVCSLVNGKTSEIGNMTRGVVVLSKKGPSIVVFSLKECLRLAKKCFLFPWNSTRGRPYRLHDPWDTGSGWL